MGKSHGFLIPTFGVLNIWGGRGGVWTEQTFFISSLTNMADMSVNKKKKESAKSKGILQRPVCGWKQRSQEVSRCPPVCPHAASAGSKGLLKNLSATNLPVNVQHLQIERIFLTANFRQSNHTMYLTVVLNRIVEWHCSGSYLLEEIWYPEWPM